MTQASISCYYYCYSYNVSVVAFVATIATSFISFFLVLL